MMESNDAYTTAMLKKLELRQAVDNHRAVMNARLVDLWTELRAITACLRDISDVMHAQYYGEHPGEHLGEALGEEGEPGSDEE